MAALFFSKATREKYPDIFRDATTVDRRTCTRTVPMQVLSLGFARTGTNSTPPPSHPLSMHAALETLGIPAYHSNQCWNNLSELHMWHAALDAKFFGIGAPFTAKEWDQLLGHVGAITDSPACEFAEELLAAYPEAKVVLVERDEDAWFESFDTAVIAAFENDQRHAWLVDGVLGPDGIVGRFRALAYKLVRGPWRSDPDDLESLRRNIRAVYRDHYAFVRRITPKERLLEFDLKDGWEPLCRFLGKEVPDVPFSRLNDAKMMKERWTVALQFKMIDMLLRWATIAAPAGLAVWAWFWLRSGRPQGLSWPGSWFRALT
ncbi:efflux pump antibiotic resistance protein [Teratosphaeria destructans]|uniref:Efflux pump antibiotic resistance protein n=1 Tax=Teratosphaeria destructans TaxID=418781 RepID=A0A9W7SKI9_9PEZI|nr:efflux pump antibiotic resistance protein [Teratosphaeria destructans]